MKCLAEIKRRNWLTLLVLLPVLFRASTAPAGDSLVYIGTYTGPKSQGIYTFRLNATTGEPTRPELAATASNPSFLAIHSNCRFLYAVGETNEFNGKPSGSVTAFAIDPLAGKLMQINQQASAGAGATHLSVDASGKYVLVANYGGGSIACLPIKADGRLGEATAFIQHKGFSVDPDRQKEPHAHGIYVDLANHFVFVPDLGLDRVMSYRFDEEKGSLVANDPAFTAIAPGSGPRHFAFHPGGNFAYAINEMFCTVTTFEYDAKRGALKEIQTISTLPSAVEKGFTTAEIEVHPNGKFLYGSNRGHDSIVVYSIDERTGQLTLVQHQSTEGKTPRSFGIDPSGNWLLAGNQDTDAIVLFKIDRVTGKLKATGHSVKVGSPVCVRFVPLTK